MASNPLMNALEWHRETVSAADEFRGLTCRKPDVWPRRDGETQTCRQVALEEFISQQHLAAKHAAHGLGLGDDPGMWLEWDLGDAACDECVRRHELAAEMRALRARKPGVMSALWSRLAKMERDDG